MPTLLWFRRDLRLGDNPALAAAASATRDRTVAGLFVVDDALWQPASPVRRAYLAASLRALNAAMGGALIVRHGDPADVVPRVAHEIGAPEVHHAADFGPYGRRRDARVTSALRALGVETVVTGSPYAIAPGRVVKEDGTAYRVFTPFYRAWLRHGWRAPANSGDVEWRADSTPCVLPDADPEVPLPPAGEIAARDRWTEFRNQALAAYGSDRDRPDLTGTSQIGHHLKWGEIHPRTLLADLGPDDETFRREIAWREFYADVLAQRPASARHSLDSRFDDAFAWDAGPRADERFSAWAAGRTGYPFVDAGMRQLRTEGWMHNRVRMVVASFLVKDLHLPWQRGAAHFMRWLRDGDLASNSHGWQWTAGCGTDAAPYHRIFNPVSQGERFDPHGDYVRRYVPELRHLPGRTAHTPWASGEGYAHGYPTPIVDHAQERRVALERFADMKADSVRR